MSKRKQKVKQPLCFYCQTALMPKGGLAREAATGKEHTCEAYREGKLKKATVLRPPSP